jgi:large subunit ribosomal protein L24
MRNMNLKTGDKVVVIAGKDKGKEGKITKILKADNKVVVEGINVAKKHIKPNGQTAGSIVEVELPIHASNVMILDPKTKKRTRIGHTVDKKGKKIRVSKKSNESLD